MENKYYDLIISLIKNHRKYPGLESILEDIANDVLEHSKVVVSTVSNEDVIRAYLEKIVATSIITVSKRMNLNTRTRNRFVETLPLVADVVVEQENVFINEEIKEETFRKEENLSVEDLPAEETFEEDSDLLEEESDDLDFVGDIQVLEDNMQEAEVQETANIVEEVDKTLVDRMINGVSINGSVAVEEELVLSEEVNDVYETLDEVEPVEEPLDEAFELVEETESSIVEEVIGPESSLKIEEQAPEFGINEIVSEQENEQEVLINENLETDEDDGIIDLSLDESEYFIQPVLDLEDVVSENVEIAQIVADEQVVDFQPPCFDCFSFQPEKRTFVKEGVFSKLYDIEKKHPEYKILQICELKYLQKLSISEIAELVELTEEEVIDVLNEIIELVKD